MPSIVKAAGVSISKAASLFSGGTPATMLHSGLADIIGQIRQVFVPSCDIHMESHSNHLSPANLDKIQSLGVARLSIGVEALFDRHLKSLCRPYPASDVCAAVTRAVAQGFQCVTWTSCSICPASRARRSKRPRRSSWRWA